MIRTSTLSARFLLASFVASIAIHAYASSPDRTARQGTTIVVARLGR